MTNLADKKCVPCEGGVPPMKQEEIKKFLTEIAGWSVSGDAKILREFKFKDFKASMAFINKVAELAEAEGHHPDIYISYNKVGLELFTHAVGGLTENDMILAAKINLIK